MYKCCMALDLIVVTARCNYVRVMFMPCNIVSGVEHWGSNTI
jgi:hypothetical protein